MTVVLLGPQRFDPNVAEAAEAVGVSGRIAVVTAGWQEREAEDEELSAHLGNRIVNLELHKRADDVFRRDAEFQEAYRSRQLRYRHLQDFYRIRLEFLIESARVIANRSAPDDILEQEQKSSINAIRMLDRHHQRQCDRVRRDFRERWEPSSRPALAEHRAELGEMLSGCAALAIAGGHVASLLNRLQLFDVAELLGADKPVLAWSAGAMAITPQVVLFHDSPPYGVDAPQILDVGLGLVEDVVALPNPEARLALGDADRMTMYARRFAPSTCLVLPRRSWAVMEGKTLGLARGALRLEADGRVVPLAEAA